MNKIIFITIGIMLTLILSGCLNKSETNENYYLNDNLPPTAKIIAPNKAYFEENIVFDASNSYDVDGKITSYYWDFGESENIEGAKVSYSYKFENNFFIDYPLIYPVTLFIKDNNGALTTTTHQIKIYPKNYKFYLDSTGLVSEKPIFSKAGINSFIYKFENPIHIKKCLWNSTINLEKPLLILIKKLTLTLIDSKGEIISYDEEKFGIRTIWKDKIVKLNGEINKDIEFKSLKIDIYSYFISHKINIIYGGEKASYICFYFSD